MKKKQIFTVTGVSLACLATVGLVACNKPEEDIVKEATPVQIDLTGQDVVEKLTKEEALVNTVVSDDTTDTKEVSVSTGENISEDNAVTVGESQTFVATAHVVTEQFTDGSYVVHKTYVSADNNYKEDETKVTVYTPKEEVVRLDDGIHKIITKTDEEVKAEKATETLESKEASTEVKTEDKTTEYNTDYVQIEKKVTDEKEIQYEETVVEKEVFDEVVEKNTERQETFVEGVKDSEDKQKEAVKETITKIEESIPKTEVKKPEKTEEKKEDTAKETQATTENKNVATGGTTNNTSNNNNTSNSNNKNTNSSNNNKSTNGTNNNSSANNSTKNNNTNSNKSSNNTTQQTTKATEPTTTQPTTTVKRVYKIEVYDTCTYEVLYVSTGNTQEEANAKGLSWLDDNGRRLMEEGHCSLAWR